MLCVSVLLLSSLAQRQSVRLLIAGLLVRVQHGERLFMGVTGL
jgi:hypothetical protein